MKINELIKKPIQVIVENNISEDMIFPDTLKREVIDKITLKLQNIQNFLLVYVNNKEGKLIKAVITSSELSALITLINQNMGSETIEDLQLETSFPMKYDVEVSEPIDTALTMFANQKTDVVVVRSSDNEYLGKVTRTKLKDWFKIMDN